jgi:hypothetical protein
VVEYPDRSDNVGLNMEGKHVDGRDEVLEDERDLDDVAWDGWQSEDAGTS